MSRSYWGKFSKIAGLAALVWLAFGFYSALSWHSTGLEKEAAQRTEIHRQNAEDRIVRVCASDPFKIKCIYEARQTQRENEREEQDLAAQKVTAWWTKIMGIAALIGMALSAVGVFLVWTTFNETRKANSIAKETLFRQLRAYVTVEALESANMTGSVSITLHNSGATPTKGIKIIYNRMQVDNGIVSAIPTEIDVPDIGGQARKCLLVEWYNWSDLFHAKSEIPTTMLGSVIYRSVVPDENGQNREFVEPFSIQKSETERKGVLQVEITRLPERTFFA